MPRYFFNTEGDHFQPDRDGILLAGPEEARNQAVIHAGEMLKDIDGRFWDAAEWRLSVTDEQGATVCVLTVRGTLDDRQ